MIKHLEYYEDELIDIHEGLMHYKDEGLKSHARWMLLKLVQKHHSCDSSPFHRKGTTFFLQITQRLILLWKNGQNHSGNLEYSRI